MNEIETLLELGEELVHAQTGGYLSELQRIILVSTLQGSRKTYDQIADECGYSPKYVKQDVAPKLWNLLSHALEEKVSKTNVKNVLERLIRHRQPSPVNTERPPTVELPPIVQTPSIPPSVTILPPPNLSGSKGNLLLVDDQPENLNLLSNLLEEQGYEVRQALDGAIALQTTQLAPPDLILLDINMPEMDGYTVCQRLKADDRTRHIPVIFVSALDEAWDKVRAFSVGGVDYIAKPFKVVEVLARVENQLKIQHLRREIEQQNLELRQTIQSLQRLSTLDELTQVANRRRFDDYLYSQWHEAIQGQYPLTLILCRIDRFKQYNDLYGHLMGDRCLCQVADTLKQAVRSEDLVCRYVGATFALILPKISSLEGQQLAQLLLEKVQALRIDFSDSSKVTISLGIASTLPSDRTSPESSIAQAERALSRAEAAGGNQLVI
jgi:diguanylate cyclase (GGDEF)-like protein